MVARDVSWTSGCSKPAVLKGRWWVLDVLDLKCPGCWKHRHMMLIFQYSQYPGWVTSQLRRDSFPGYYNAITCWPKAVCSFSSHRDVSFGCISALWICLISLVLLSNSHGSLNFPSSSYSHCSSISLVAFICSLSLGSLNSPGFPNILSGSHCNMLAGICSGFINPLMYLVPTKAPLDHGWVYPGTHLWLQIPMCGTCV